MRRSVALLGVVLTVVLTGGTGAAAFAAAPYPPPATGTGTVNPSRVKQGHCTTFSGDGFAADAAVEIYDDSTHYGTTSAGKNGDFQSHVCFGNDARVGDHVLSAEGHNAAATPADPAERVVTATVTVTGVEQSDNGNGNGNGPKNNAASTTSVEVVSPFTLAVLALLLIPSLSGVLLLFERRHRRRRSTSRTA